MKTPAELASEYLDAWIDVHGRQAPHGSSTIVLGQMFRVRQKYPDLHLEIKNRGADVIASVMRFVRTAYKNGMVNPS